jgi:uncharacterized protein YjbI with pentapeptide repeats
MFAGEAFAQLAFAEVGGAFFQVNAADTITFTDSQSAQANFVGAQAESLTLTTTQAAQANFVGAQAETATYTTTQAANVNFAPTVAETATFTDTQAGAWGTYAQTDESLTLTDSQCAIGWFKINDNQNANWGTAHITIEEVADFGGFTFGGVPFAGSLTVQQQSGYPVGYTPTTAWNTVNTTDNASWIVIDNRQKC